MGAESVTPTPAKKMRGFKNIMTPKLAAALDVCKVSDRKAVHLVISVVEAVGLEVQNYIINKTSIHNAREKIRAEQFKNIKERFNKNELGAICLHWDGKLLPALTGNEKVDRLPVIISCGRTEQLLEVPALKSGTGREQASAVCKAILEWGLQDHIKALVFDTTAVNTGRFNGTCTIIEHSLQKQLLWLPCRHHILEVLLKSAFEVKMSKTESPNVKIFEQFKNAWGNINQNNYQSGMEDNDVKKYLTADKDKITEFVNDAIKTKQPRDDYREFLELTLLFLGETPPIRNAAFRAPGAVHHARWMAKAIYCLKIFLFRREFDLAVKDRKALSNLCIFIVSIYVEMWFSASSAAQAPYKDFQLLKKLDSFKNIDADISQVALHKFKNHLWYLSPECVALAFFDDSVSFESKKEMVKALSREALDEDVKRASIQNLNFMRVIEGGMDQFISSETNNFFLRFKINTAFLKNDPTSWPTDNNFKTALQIVNDINVVNDTAERAVKLMQDYNPMLTKDEEQKQYILQVVKNYQKQFPMSTKQILSQNFL